MTPTLTDEQVVRVLAERDGYTNIVWDWFDSHTAWKDWTWERNGVCGHGLSKYLTSRDALTPVLEGLSPEEWQRLIDAIAPHMETNGGSEEWQNAKALFTMPARNLAHAVASVLMAGKEAGK